MQGKPTLEKIAQRTGLSVSTVSRVLRGRADVSDQARRAVEEHLRTLGAVPATGRRRGRPSKTAPAVIAVICHRHDNERHNPFAAPMISAALNAGAIHGARTFALDWPLNTPAPDELSQATGAILIGSSSHAAECASRMATVTLDTFIPGSGADGVCPDYRRGAFDAITELLRKGHRRISIISGHFGNDEGFSTQLYDGARRALDLSGVEKPKDFLSGMAYRPEEGYATAAQLLRVPKDERPTVIFGNDHAVLGALRAAHDLGIKVPEELAIVGTDDIELGQYSVPRLSTVRVDKELLVKVAMERLLWRIQHRSSPPCRIVLECPFVQRDSC
ncbi:MAG TPA: LacI family DNA-binding transcriptional regulator [Planctomycetota bacterium]|nr:LacI family DNA-binding transcriptional regulator [Planctomycetota bacterium]